MKTKQIIKEKNGTTLVEMIVTLLLISIMMAMAAASLSSASKIFARLQKMQYAQSILDTTMTELRSITKDACEYIKIYNSAVGGIGEQGGVEKGNALEFVNEEGYVVLVSTDGCQKTDIYIAEKKTGEAKAVDSGQLLTRYYFRNSSDRTYTYQNGGVPVARAVGEAFGKGFYMGNYLEVTYAFPNGVNVGDRMNSIVATVTLYTDQEKTEVIATDSEILEFRHSVIRKDDVTAKN